MGTAACARADLLSTAYAVVISPKHETSTVLLFVDERYLVNTTNIFVLYTLESTATLCMYCGTVVAGSTTQSTTQYSVTCYFDAREATREDSYSRMESGAPSGA